jgi:AP-4 complex subunit epsilon-1
LKKTFPLPANSKKKLKELIIRAIYVEMLGQDASFAYIKAVELCASTNLLQKKAGYLAGKAIDITCSQKLVYLILIKQFLFWCDGIASLCLSPEHEFRFMLVNQIQRDMGRY